MHAPINMVYLDGMVHPMNLGGMTPSLVLILIMCYEE
uniref:Uncharacterized protein n=1 Tax=Arundo donax TaxID=35708 RepID=A0A0A9DJR3_ARUDO